MNYMYVYFWSVGWRYVCRQIYSKHTTTHTKGNHTCGSFMVVIVTIMQFSKSICFHSMLLSSYLYCSVTMLYVPAGVGGFCCWCPLVIGPSSKETAKNLIF